MGGAKAPSKIGWPVSGDWSGGLYRRYGDFQLADPLGAGVPSALACNATTQEQESSPVCCLMQNSAYPGAPFFDAGRFEAKAPALKSTNVNLWEAWHLQYEPLLASGAYGQYAALCLSTFQTWG